MTRTEAIVKAVTEELNSRRAELNGEKALRSVQLVISIDAKTGGPREVIFRKESRSVRAYIVREEPLCSIS